MGKAVRQRVVPGYRLGPIPASPVPQFCRNITDSNLSSGGECAEQLAAEPAAEVAPVPEPQRAPEWTTEQRTGRYYVVVHCPSHLWPGIYISYPTFELHFKQEGRFVTPLTFRKCTTYREACSYYASHFVAGAAAPRCYQ